jgi:TonB family protein
LDLELCTFFEESLRTDLENSIPGVRFIARESVTNILEGRGFLALDAYFPDVLRAVTTQAGADVLVTDTLKWQPDGYELTSEVYDSVRDKKLDQFQAKIVHPMHESSGEPVVFTDPVSGVAIIVLGSKPIHSSMVQEPKCIKCADPPYPEELRSQRIQGHVVIMATLTQQGALEQIRVVDSSDARLTSLASQTVQGWQIKPATRRDRKPISTRLPIEVTFRMK